MPRELLSVHIGQCGIQLGASLWERYCLEHDVSPDGAIGDDASAQQGFSYVFRETSEGKCNPKALFIDLEPSATDEMRQGKFRNLYSPDQLLSWNEDAAGLFPRGYMVSDKKLLNTVYERLRHFLEDFDSFQGCMLMRSVGGGTGSGYTSLFLDNLNDDFGSKPVIEVSIHPSKGSGVIEPYNAVLSTGVTTGQIGCTFMMDNEAVQKMGLGNEDTETYGPTNQLIAQAVSAITASLRFEGSLNVDLAELPNNLVPFKRIRFPYVSFGPVHDKNEKCKPTVQSLTKACFEPRSRMCSVPAELGQYLAVCLVYSGDVVQQRVISAISHVKELGLAKFVNWSPGVKIGICHKPPTNDPATEWHFNDISLAAITNSTSCGRYWAAINRRFDLMYEKAAFLHWFLVEGMDEEAFLDAREATAAIENDYLKLEQPQFL